MTLLFGLLSAPTWAQEPTLAAYMDAAVANHPRMVISRAGTDTAKAETADAGSALLPTVRGSAGWAYNQYDATATFPNPAGGPPVEIVIVPHEQVQAALNVRVPLLDAPGIVRWQGMRLGADALEADQRAAEQDLRLEVARAWYAAAAAQQVVAAAERSKSAAEENLRYLSLRAEAGAASEVTVQRAQLEVANTDLLLIDARRVWLTARRTLSTLSGLPEPESLPPGPDLSDDLPPEEDLVVAANANRPELAAARTRVSQLKTASGGAWLAYTPTVTGTATESYTNAAGFSGQETSYRIGVDLDWLLLDLGDRPSDVRKAKAALVTAEAKLQQASDDVRDEVHAAWLTAEAAAARVVASRRGAEVGRLAADEVRNRFQAGTATQVEVIQAERDALDAEVQRIRSEGELAIARLALQRAAGAPIDPS